MHFPIKIFIYSFFLFSFPLYISTDNNKKKCAIGDYNTYIPLDSVQEILSYYTTLLTLINNYRELYNETYNSQQEDFDFLYAAIIDSMYALTRNIHTITPYEWKKYKKKYYELLSLADNLSIKKINYTYISEEKCKQFLLRLISQRYHYYFSSLPYDYKESLLITRYKENCELLKNLMADIAKNNKPFNTKEFIALYDSYIRIVVQLSILYVCIHYGLEEIPYTLENMYVDKSSYENIPTFSNSLLLSNDLQKAIIVYINQGKNFYYNYSLSRIIPDSIIVSYNILLQRLLEYKKPCSENELFLIMNEYESITQNAVAYWANNIASVHNMANNNSNDDNNKENSINNNHNTDNDNNQSDSDDKENNNDDNENDENIE